MLAVNERGRIGDPRKMLVPAGDSLSGAAALPGEEFPFNMRLSFHSNAAVLASPQPDQNSDGQWIGRWYRSVLFSGCACSDAAQPTAELVLVIKDAQRDLAVV